MSLTPEDTAGLRLMLDEMAERITELETDVARLKAEHAKTRTEQAVTRAKLDALDALLGGDAKTKPGGKAPGNKNQDGD